jgi:hypothetical protein
VKLMMNDRFKAMMLMAGGSWLMRFLESEA